MLDWEVSLEFVLELACLAFFSNKLFLESDDSTWGRDIDDSSKEFERIIAALAL